MADHCTDTKQEIENLLCEQIDETMWRCDMHVMKSKFCMTVQKCDYLERRVEFTIEEAGIGMATHYDGTFIVRQLLDRLPPDLHPEKIEAYVFVRTPSSPVDVVIHFREVPLEVDPIGEKNDRWYVQPAVVKRAPRPVMPRSLQETIPSPQAEVDPDPGEPIPIVQTGVWKVTLKA